MYVICNYAVSLTVSVFVEFDRSALYPRVTVDVITIEGNFLSHSPFFLHALTMIMTWIGDKIHSFGMLCNHLSMP